MSTDQSEASHADTTVHMFTDGSCLGNPGPGGWGVLLRWRGTEKEIYGGADDTTNNRMEMTAVIRGLETLSRPMNVHVHTDSRYVMDGITKWLEVWKRKKWRTASKKPVKNKALWMELDEAQARHDVTWHWVKGHAGHEGNERADELAGRGAKEAQAGE